MEQKEKTFESTWVMLVCVSVAYIAGGVLLLLFPQVSLPALCQAMGILLIIVGIVLVFAYFLRKRYLTPGHFEFAGGAACILLGIFSLMRTQEVAFAFSQILALLVLGDSLLKLQNSTDLLRLKEQKWWVVLLAAGASILLAMIALANPFGSDQLRLQYTYVVLIADGVLNIAVVLFLRHAHRRYEDLSAEDTEEFQPAAWEHLSNH
ncbi:MULTISPECIES: HdeD family acid-resistance protein [Caproicibacterium]|uniref:DUF308 domain-containing protein n=1 Tax=Caproicibacterium argilliputei TaxID=3030016 RepID=A0AA97DAW4_9FIRM|nr:DUF308 domain-containing protein [Caproicibacterium argilliputei]WOC32542.1 DUF308 domain-containing protein [Caproicibacterium argilliputei]